MVAFLVTNTYTEFSRREESILAASQRIREQFLLEHNKHVLEELGFDPIKKAIEHQLTALRLKTILEEGNERTRLLDIYYSKVLALIVLGFTSFVTSIVWFLLMLIGNNVLADMVFYALSVLVVALFVMRGAEFLRTFKRFRRNNRIVLNACKGLLEKMEGRTPELLEAAGVEGLNTFLSKLKLVPVDEFHAEEQRPSGTKKGGRKRSARRQRRTG